MYKLSPSSLSLMKECPRCFWLEKHKVWKRPVSMFPSLPSGMDKILKEHFDRFIAKKELPPEIKDKIKNCSLFNDKEKLRIWRNNLRGISFTDKEGNVLSGSVDNILVSDGKLIVLDFKTRGFPLKEDTHEHYVNQMDIYNFLLRKNGYETCDYAYLLFYYPKEVLSNGDVVFFNEIKKINVDVSNADKLFNNAVKLLNSDCPSKSCEWCERV